MPREDESNQPAKCGYCNKEFKYKRNVRNHIDTVHGKSFPEKSILVAHDKQQSLLPFCSPKIKKPRLDVPTTESSSDVGTSKGAHNVIEEVPLSGAKMEDEFTGEVEFPSVKTEILSEWKRVHNDIMKKLDKIEKHTDPCETIAGGTKLKPKKSKEQQEKHEDKSNTNIKHLWLHEAKSISDLLNYDEIKLFEAEDIKFLYCSICYDEIKVKESCKQDRQKISGKIHISSLPF